MDPHLYLAFIVATVIMIALPGPSVILTVAHSLSFGWQPALFTVSGATMGIAVQLIIASIGLSSLLTIVAEAFDWLRWAGAFYLVYLGIRQWRSSNASLHFESTTTTRTNLFFQGLVITIPNPKSLVFIAAFLPQFIDTTLPVGAQFIFIVPTFLFITFTVTSMWAIFAGFLRGFLQSQRAYRSVLKTTGGMMIMAGVGLALARHSG
ncbi:LysE family translocator [Desulfopila sp. IMCC35008]|uniref:LysE family translocator n=1 Tax=Desulfopila sp. IMCC35008 TaxID=2653858 RepID=UPI0013D07D2B|nr:LysE family translocator [Desulfopila sp. IMCC35008]